MTLNTVTLTWDFTDALQAGDTAFLQAVPTSPPWVNAAGMTIVTGEPLTQDFTGGPGSLAGIIANDNTLSPASQGYEITVKKADGTVLYDQTVILNHAAGATQDLSSLTPAGQIGVVSPYLLAGNNLDDVDDAATALANLGGATSADLTAEVTRATTAEGVLAGGVSANATAIAAETTRAEGAETTLAGGIGTNATAIAAETSRAEAAEALLMPIENTRAFVASGDTKVYWQFEQTGGTEAVPGFEIAVQDHNYGSPAVNQTSFYMGLNAAEVDGGSLPYAFWNIHPWAGDTNCLEWNFSAGTQIPGVQDVNWLQYFVSQIDGGGNLTLRHPDTSSSTMNFRSGPTLGINYLIFNPSASFPILFGAGANVQESRSGLTVTQFTLTAPAPLTGSGGVQSLFLCAATGTTEDFYKFNNVTYWTETKTTSFWAMQNGGGGGGYAGNQMVLWPGATADAAMVQVFTRLQTSGSLVVGTAALATSATSGFLYIPSCAGAPTGTPTVRTGTVPLVYDTTDGRLYLFEGAAWHYIGMTA